MMDDLVNQLPCGVVLINEAGLIIKINATAGQQLGYEPDELVGQSISKILTVAGRLFYQTHFYPLINLHGRVEEVALTLLTRTGDRIPILLNAVRQSSDGLICCAYLSVGHRHAYEAELIQARKAAEQARLAVEESEARYRTLSADLEHLVQERTHELEAANEEYAAINEELTESNQLLNRSNDDLQKFAYVASHDLQEPLRKIQQFGDLLRTNYTGTSEEEQFFLERMQSAANRMSTLIRDLLDYSRVSTQRDRNSPTSLQEIVDRALMTLELVIIETKAEVMVEALPTIQGDALQLDQLFQNLLSNALKYRQPDIPPRIQILSQLVPATELPTSIHPARSSNAYYRIDVVDNGVGFDEKYLDRIFQVFQRLYGKKEYMGTGIGLAICEKVVANHGGAITANSQPGQGATFHVYLPQ
jgi:PAS domain S-box-containing protein